MGVQKPWLANLSDLAAKHDRRRQRRDWWQARLNGAIETAIAFVALYAIWRLLSAIF